MLSGGIRRRTPHATLPGSLDAVFLLEAHDGGRQLRRIVAMGVRGIDDILLDDDDGELLETPDIHIDRLRAPTDRPPRVRVAVDDDVVDEVLADVREEHAQVLARRQVLRLTRLGGDIADIDLEPGGGGQRIPNVADQEVRQHAAEQASGGR